MDKKRKLILKQKDNKIGREKNNRKEERIYNDRNISKT